VQDPALRRELERWAAVRSYGTTSRTVTPIV
jgi:hypothetical protein